MRILNGAHLTATDRRALAAMIGNGWASAHSRHMRYQLAPSADEPGAHVLTIRKNERDDWGRPVERVRRAVLMMN